VSPTDVPKSAIHLIGAGVGQVTDFLPIRQLLKSVPLQSLSETSHLELHNPSCILYPDN